MPRATARRGKWRHRAGTCAGRLLTAAAPRRRPTRRAPASTRPVSMGRGTRRVQLVREGGGAGGASACVDARWRCLNAICAAAYPRSAQCDAPHHIGSSAGPGFPAARGGASTNSTRDMSPSSVARDTPPNCSFSCPPASSIPTFPPKSAIVRPFAAAECSAALRAGGNCGASSP